MPLDGAAETWWVKIADKVYGPYSREQMARFVAEGRVTPTSLVSLDQADWLEARQSPALAAALADARAFKSDNGEHALDANILVYVEMSSGVPLRVDHELRRMGQVTEINPGLYLLRTQRTAGVVRNALSQKLGRGDKLLVIDSTRDRLAWFNLGPETDARIREVWNAPVKA